MYKEITFEGTDRHYILYDDGRLYDCYCKHFRKPRETYKGYLKYYIYIYGKVKGFFVHRLVMQTFNPVEGMEHLQVNHIDCNKHNNNLSNLEWCDQSHNQKHAFANGLISRKGEKNSAHKLTETEVIEICELLVSGASDISLAEIYHVSQSTISAIRNHRNWAYLTKDYNF